MMRLTLIVLLGLVLVLSCARSVAAAEPSTSLHLPAIVSSRDCGAEPTTPFGVQMYGDTGRTNRHFPYLVYSGAHWVRAPIYWDQVEPVNVAPDQFNWAHADRVVGAVRDGCLNMIVTHSNDPAWAAADGTLPVATTALDDLAEYLSALVERYDGDGFNDAPGSPIVRHWELYNEPDDTIPLDGAKWGYYGQEYAQLLATAYPAIKAADPQAQVLLGGIAYDWYEGQDGPFYRDFLDDVLGAGGGAYFDIMNFHAYPPFAASWTSQGPGLLEKTQFMREKLAQYGLHKPIIITESCHHSNDALGLPGSEVMQTRYVVQLYAQSIAAGARAMIWFALVDPGGGYPLESGLITNETPPHTKPAYTAYQVAAAELGMVRFERRLLLDETGVSDMEVYKYRDAVTGQAKYVAWLEPIDSRATQMLRISTTRAVVRDILGKTSIVNDLEDGTADGQILVTVTSQPVYVIAD